MWLLRLIYCLHVVQGVAGGDAGDAVSHHFFQAVDASATIVTENERLSLHYFFKQNAGRSVKRVIAKPDKRLKYTKYKTSIGQLELTR